MIVCSTQIKCMKEKLHLKYSFRQLDRSHLKTQGPSKRLMQYSFRLDNTIRGEEEEGENLKLI